jgi:hypothetical protein
MPEDGRAAVVRPRPVAARPAHARVGEGDVLDREVDLGLDQEDARGAAAAQRDQPAAVHDRRLRDDLRRRQREGRRLGAAVEDDHAARRERRVEGRFVAGPRTAPHRRRRVLDVDHLDRRLARLRHGRRLDRAAGAHSSPFTPGAAGASAPPEALSSPQAPRATSISVAAARLERRCMTPMLAASLAWR